MKKWLTEFMKDMSFLARKTRRSSKVMLKAFSAGAFVAGADIASASGEPAYFDDPLTSDTLLTGEPSHYVGQNLNHLHGHDHF